MAFFSSMNIIGSGMTAQQLRLDVISENIVNQRTTRTEQGGAYRRKVVVLEAESDRNGFRAAMAAAGRKLEGVSNRGYETAGGVRVAAIQEDDSEEMGMMYDPTHPDANEQGYVELPNITLVKEMTDAMAATQAYNADVTAFNTLKQVMSKAMEIGR